MAATARPQVYEIRSTFRAPLGFVFDWCTHYTTDDPRLEKEDYQRRILSRGKRQVVYEDLQDLPGGWMWSRQTVTLHPPNRWHAEAFGSHRVWSLDYTLRDLPDGRTEMTLRGERRPTPIGGRNPPKARLERELRASWKNFGVALERDFRRRSKSRRRKRN